jgi:dephospho-CoA kinase
LKFLQEIGYDDIFNVDEVNEIKTLYDKAQEEIKENFEQEISNGGGSYAEKLEERMIEKKQVLVEEEKEALPEVIDGQQAPKPAESQVVAKITPKFEMRAHFDSVEGVHYSPSQQVMATVSQDCLVNLWRIKDISKTGQ